MISISRLLLEGSLSDQDYDFLLKSFDPREQENIIKLYKQSPEKYEHIKSIIPQKIKKAASVLSQDV